METRSLSKRRASIEDSPKRAPARNDNPTNPVYKKPVENHTQTLEKDHKVQNQQFKVNWQNLCKKIDKIGILCGDKPRDIWDQKATSLLYLCIVIEGRRTFKSKYPHFLIEEEPMKELWKLV